MRILSVSTIGPVICMPFLARGCSSFPQSIVFYDKLETLEKNLIHRVILSF